MATYKGIKGVKLQSLATDPSVFADGEVWYNTSSYTLKYNVEGAGVWASANAIPANRGGGCGIGTQTAGLYAGGSAPIPALALTIEFDGTDWTSGGTQNTGRVYQQGTGTQTACFVSVGDNSGNQQLVEEYNGTAWTEVTNVSRVASEGGAASGTLTAGAIIGSNTAAARQLVEDYDGTTWTSAPSLTVAHERPSGSSVGTQTAALLVGSAEGPTGGTVESYNGTAWTAVTGLTTIRGIGGAAGTQTAALAFAGYFYTVPTGTAKKAQTEKWDGTSWTEVGDIATAKGYVYGFGSQSAAVLAGGVTGPSSTPNSVTAEVWNDPLETTKTVTTS